MKIRNGFVSNSSSSSFVILGVGQNGDGEDIMERDYTNGIEALYVEGEFDYIVGIVIASGDDYDFDESTTSVAEMHDMATKVSEELNVDINEVKLITGVRPC